MASEDAIECGFSDGLGGRDAERVLEKVDLFLRSSSRAMRVVSFFARISFGRGNEFRSFGRNLGPSLGSRIDESVKGATAAGKFVYVVLEFAKIA